MSISKIFIHAIFSTKERKPLISPEIEKKIYSCLYREFSELGCRLIIVNGLQDHIHCLFTLNTQKSVSEIIKHVKGSSSHYINQNNICPDKFSWQKGYATFSVGEKEIDRVYRYIRQQKMKVHNLKEEVIDLSAGE
jgi:putative transposase